MLKTYILTKDGVSEQPDIARARQMAKEKQGIVWIDLRSCKKDELQQVAGEFGFHHVAVKAVLDPYTRPHLVEYEDHFHINLTMIETKHGKDPEPLELHVFLSQDYIITASRNSGGKLVDRILDLYRDTPSLVERGSFYALYMLAEILTDSYFPIVEELDDEIDKLEDEMLKKADEQSLHRLLHLKRILFDLRRYLGPQRDVFNELTRRDFPFLKEDFQIYFQDVYNRMIRVFDVMDTSRDIISGTLDIYQSAVSNRLNDIMKILTVFATILGILTLITGFFGMNFRHFPGLDIRDAVPVLVVVMLVIAAGMILVFRKAKWL